MINSISLKSFRRYKALDVQIKNNLTIISGPNAIGKTTILEAIYLISTSKSHRAKDYKDLIKEGYPFSKINIKTDRKEFELVISNEGKRMAINRVPIKKISEFIGELRTVMFSPQDLMLITGEKALRRNFIDLQISMLNKKYLTNVSEYKKLLKNRNDILKSDSIDLILLNTITEQMISREKDIITSRENFIKLLNEELIYLKGKMGFNEEIQINYVKSINEDLASFYKSKLNYDRLTKVTNFGVHRDSYVFYINQHEASMYASQGQIRSIALSLKVAITNLITRIFKESPVLLLDDVFSELDNTRKDGLVEFLTGHSQTFITTTSVEGLPKKLLEKAFIINLKE